MTEVATIASLSIAEARSLTDEIKVDAERLWAKLLEAYEGGAHLALGYSSWGVYFETEFGGSKRRGYELLNAGKVLDVVRNSALTPANEAQANELAPLLKEPDALREVWANVVEIHPEPTAAAVREVVQSRMGVHFSSETDLWSTPQDLFDELDAEFGFTLDVCATPENAKCPAFFTEADDGLLKQWDGTCWMNPPYGDAISAWVSKARASATDGATVVCLVPARVDTGWWWDNCRYGEVRFLRGRLKFGGSVNSAPFPSAVVIFGREPNTLSAYWERSK